MGAAFAASLGEAVTDEAAARLELGQRDGFGVGHAERAR